MGAAIFDPLFKDFGIDFSFFAYCTYDLIGFQQISFKGFCKLIDRWDQKGEVQLSDEVRNVITAAIN